MLSTVILFDRDPSQGLINFFKIFKIVMSMKFNIKSNLHYARVITPKRVTSGRSHLRILAPGQRCQHSSEKSCSDGDTASDLTDPGFKPQVYRTSSNVSTTELTDLCKKILVVFAFQNLGASHSYLPRAPRSLNPPLNQLLKNWHFIMVYFV